MSQKIYQVDSFTAERFKGNPAAVCLLSENEHKDAEWFIQVAQEMNVSETAFVQAEGERFRLRWFTPKTEVNLCGHATLASAHILWAEGIVPLGQEIIFNTKSGELRAQRLAEEWIQLNFPILRYVQTECPISLEKALGVKPLFIAGSDFDYLVELESAEIVRTLQPDFALLNMLTHHGVIVTARSDQENYDFISRVFCPSLGIPEDPVTGSAHCVLAAYWQEKLGKSSFKAYQASARGGILNVQVDGERVFLQGQAVTTLRGELV